VTKTRAAQNSACNAAPLSNEARLPPIVYKFSAQQSARTGEVDASPRIAQQDLR
jgi:hypothetical protein